MSEQMKRADLEPLVNEAFTMIGNNVTAEVELIEVVDKSNENVEGFSALFRVPRDNHTGQGVFQLIHDKIGEHNLLMVPVGEDGNDIHYEMIISRLKES